MGLLKKNATPNPETMRETAEALGIELSDPESTEAMIADLRTAFAKRLEGAEEDDIIRCAVCGEVTDSDEAIVCCPYCGDEGSDEETASALESGEEPTGEEEAEDEDEAIEGEDIDPGEDAEEPASVDLEEEPAAAAPDPEPAPTPAPKKKKKRTTKKAEKAETPAPEPAAAAPEKSAKAKGKGKAKKTETAPAAAPEKPAESTAIAPDLKKALAVEDKKIEAAQKNIVTGSYDLGVALVTVHKGELWKAAGHKTFNQYLAAKGIGRTFAYDLMTLVEKFDKKTFEEVGRKKLMLVARAGGPKTEEGQNILDKAKSGASVSQLEAETGGKGATAGSDSGKGSRTKHEVKAHERGGTAEPPPKDGRITLLAKVGAKPQTIPFLDRKSRKPVKEWAPETFAEVKIAEDVSMFLALKTDKDGKVTGVTVAYKRAETAEAAE